MVYQLDTKRQLGKPTNDIINAVSKHHLKEFRYYHPVAVIRFRPLRWARILSLCLPSPWTCVYICWPEASSSKLTWQPSSVLLLGTRTNRHARLPTSSISLIIIGAKMPIVLYMGAIAFRLRCWCSWLHTHHRGQVQSGVDQTTMFITQTTVSRPNLVECAHIVILAAYRRRRGRRYILHNE